MHTISLFKKEKWPPESPGGRQYHPVSVQHNSDSIENIGLRYIRSQISGAIMWKNAACVEDLSGNFRGNE